MRVKYGINAVQPELLSNSIPPVKTGGIISIVETYMAKPKKQIEEIGAPTSDAIWIPTGCTLLDEVIGGGRGLGVPSGVVLNICALESGFKTFLACEIIASAYHTFGKKFKWVYDDAESGFTFDTQKLYGFEIMPSDPNERFKSGTVEELYVNLRTFIDSVKQGEFGIYTIDSLDGLSSEELDTLADKRYRAGKKSRSSDSDSDTTPLKGSFRMGSAKFLSQEFFKTVTDQLKGKNILLIIISQLRYNTDPRSMEKWTRAGGKALDFYAYSVIRLDTPTKIKRKDVAVGAVVRARTTKLKAPRPYRSCTFTGYYDLGIDDIGSCIDYLYDCRGKDGRLVKASKAIVWTEGEEPYDRAELIATIEQDKLQGGSMYQELKDRTIAKWEAFEDSIKTDRPGKYATSWNRGEATTLADEEDPDGED